MPYIGIGIFLLIVLLSVIFRIAAAFRLTIPLLYALLAPTLFSKWFYANYDLANIIGYALLALTVLSWLFTFIKKIRGIIDARREEKISDELLRRRILESTEVDENGYKIVNLDGLYRD